MPLVFRTMVGDATGSFPHVANDATSLGIRVQEEIGNQQDINVVDGRVWPGREGMSVSPSVSVLPIHRVPRRFKGLVPREMGVPKGKDTLRCWRMGEGSFEDGYFASELNFMTEPEGSPIHGVISPNREMLLSEYRHALAMTASSWALEPWPWEPIQ